MSVDIFKGKNNLETIKIFFTAYFRYWARRWYSLFQVPDELREVISIALRFLPNLISLFRILLNFKWIMLLKKYFLHHLNRKDEILDFFNTELKNRKTKMHSYMYSRNILKINLFLSNTATITVLGFIYTLSYFFQ